MSLLCCLTAAEVSPKNTDIPQSDSAQHGRGSFVWSREWDRPALGFSFYSELFTSALSLEVAHLSSTGQHSVAQMLSPSTSHLFQTKPCETGGSSHDFRAGKMSTNDPLKGGIPLTECKHLCNRWSHLKLFREILAFPGDDSAHPSVVRIKAGADFTPVPVREEFSTAGGPGSKAWLKLISCKPLWIQPHAGPTSSHWLVPIVLGNSNDTD